MKILAFLAVAASMLTVTAPAAATPSLANIEFQRHAYGELGLADGLEIFKVRLNETPENTEIRFQLGALQFLHAIEGLQQDLFRLGAGNRSFSSTRISRRLIPVFRIPVPKNPDAESATYEKTRQVLEKFVARLERAEATLAEMGSAEFRTEIDLSKLMADVNADGKLEENENLIGIVFETLTRNVPRNLTELRSRNFDGALIVNFDNADAKWLQGYSNLLAGIGKFMLAFDYEHTYNTSFHVIFGETANEFGSKLAGTRGSQEEIDKLVAEISEIDRRMKTVFTKEQSKRQRELQRKSSEIRRDKELSEEQKTQKKSEFQSELDELNALRKEQGTLRGTKRTAERRLGRLSNSELGQNQFGGFMEPIAFIHSINWPVESPELLQQTHKHWQKVLELNHVTWEMIQSETDNDREWLPNASQDGPGGIKVEQETIDNWLNAVKFGEAVLNGELLVPSLRFGKGINIKRFFETAQSFDPVAFVTGHNSIDYVDDGKIIDGSEFNAMNRQLRRNFGLFALWFN